MSLQVDVAQNPFPWSVALLASHQNIQIDWLAGKLQYDGKTTVEDIEGALAGKLKGKEVSQRGFNLLVTLSNQLISLWLGCVLR
jgi:hypothetical protein